MARLTIAEALRDGLREEMTRDHRVFCIGEDIGVPGGWGGAFTVTLGLEKDFPDRIIDTPISENGFFGVALGTALVGLRPVADVQYGDFLFCAMDQIVNQIAKMRYMSGGKLTVPIVMRAPVGATGRSAQHAQNLESIFLSVPGIKIICPATAYDAKGLLKAAIRDDNPVLMFEHKLLYGSKGARAESGAVDASSEIPEGDYVVPIGQGVVRRAGTDVTIIGTLLMMHQAMIAAEQLAASGIHAEVIDPRSLVPFDWGLVESSVAKTRRVVVVEEGPRTGGIGAEIVATVAERMSDYLIAPPQRVASPDIPVPFSPPMENYYRPDVPRICQAVRRVMDM
ncbi:MAG: alpha-ketoacid dehydrogenase subunit beta [Candidatus Omnitrophica bacterium]|nr:alpha-ketoacid dehydrogenase subunit beta [Candidatus Omnitrophota bacterium]